MGGRNLFSFQSLESNCSEGFRNGPQRPGRQSGFENPVHFGGWGAKGSFPSARPPRGRQESGRGKRSGTWWGSWEAGRRPALPKASQPSGDSRPPALTPKAPQGGPCPQQALDTKGLDPEPPGAGAARPV